MIFSIVSARFYGLYGGFVGDWPNAFDICGPRKSLTIRFSMHSRGLHLMSTNERAVVIGLVSFRTKICSGGDWKGAFVRGVSRFRMFLIFRARPGTIIVLWRKWEIFQSV